MISIFTKPAAPEKYLNPARSPRNINLPGLCLQPKIRNFTAPQHMISIITQPAAYDRYLHKGRSPRDIYLYPAPLGKINFTNIFSSFSPYSATTVDKQFKRERETETETETERERQRDRKRER